MSDKRSPLLRPITRNSLFSQKKKKKKNWHDLPPRAASATGNLVIDSQLFTPFFYLTSHFTCHVRQKNDGVRIAQVLLG